MKLENQGRFKSPSSSPPYILEINPSLWVEKYAPENLDELVGNRGAIEALYEWLNDWDDVVFKGLKK